MGRCEHLVWWNKIGENYWELKRGLKMLMHFVYILLLLLLIWKNLTNEEKIARWMLFANHVLALSLLLLLINLQYKIVNRYNLISIKWEALGQYLASLRLARRCQLVRAGSFMILVRMLFFFLVFPESGVLFLFFRSWPSFSVERG